MGPTCYIVLACGNQTHASLRFKETQTLSLRQTNSKWMKMVFGLEPSSPLLPRSFIIELYVIRVNKPLYDFISLF